MKEFLIMLLITSTVTGLFFGTIDTYSPNGEHKGCKYESIASFHPARVLVCEILRKRFKND